MGEHKNWYIFTAMGVLVIIDGVAGSVSPEKPQVNGIAKDIRKSIDKLPTEQQLGALKVHADWLGKSKDIECKKKEEFKTINNTVKMEIEKNEKERQREKMQMNSTSGMNTTLEFVSQTTITSDPTAQKIFQKTEGNNQSMWTQEIRNSTEAPEGQPGFLSRLLRGFKLIFGR